MLLRDLEQARAELDSATPARKPAAREQFSIALERFASLILQKKIPKGI